jgi:hypothetical protein
MRIEQKSQLGGGILALLLNGRFSVHGGQLATRIVNLVSVGLAY